MLKLKPYCGFVRTTAFELFRPSGYRKVLNILGLALLLLGSTDLFAQVKINRVFCSGSLCPNPLELVPNTPTTVNLRGRRLGRLKSGQTVSPTGVYAPLVLVQLGPTRRYGTRRKITLTATNNEAVLELTFQTQAGETVKAPIQLSIPEPTPAKVVITSVVTDPPMPTSTVPYRFGVTVENLGSTRTDTSITITGFCGSKWLAPPLLGRQSQVVWFETGGVSPGGFNYEPRSHQCIFKVERQYGGPEHTFTYNFDVSGPPLPKPDLIISNVDVIPTTPTMRGAITRQQLGLIPYAIEVTVTNQGPGVYFFSCWPHACMTTQVTIIDTNCDAKVNPGVTVVNSITDSRFSNTHPRILAPGVSKNYYLEAGLLLYNSPGTRACYFRVNAEMAETNTNNNIFNKAWTVSP